MHPNSETLSAEQINTLVSAAQSGDEQAFGELYDYFLPLVFRFVRLRCNDEALAEDITSDIFFKMLRALPRFKVQKNVSFPAWLFRIAKNTLIDSYRRACPTNELNDETPDLRQATERETELHLHKARLVAAIDNLPAMQGQAIILKYFSELKNSEIAAVLDKSETAVRILQSRGLKKLQTLLAE